MNTQTHIIAAMALGYGSKQKLPLLPLFLGGGFPDLSMLFFVIAGLVQRVPQTDLWNEMYYDPFWQMVIDVFNSIPVFAGLLLLGWWLKKRWLTAFSFAALFHTVADFLLHNDDAHRHFLPFSQWRFESPVSYWDAGHHGAIASGIEMILLLTAVLYLSKRVPKKWQKFTLWIVMLLSLLMYSIMIGYYMH